MAITRKQGMAMAIVIAAGLLAGTGILLTERRTVGEAAGHAEEGGGRAASKTAGQTEAGERHGHGGTGGGDAEHSEHAERGEHGEHEEGHIELSDEQVAKAGIEVQAAGPAKVQAAAEFAGEVRFNEDRTAHVVPRMAGVAEHVSANLGQAVRKGQVLAVIASTSLSEQRSELLTAQRRRDAARVTFEREKGLWQEKISAEQDYLAAQSALHEADIAVENARQKLAAVGAVGSAGALNRFEIRAPFDGTVVEKHFALGEAVKEDASIFTLSDLGTVWAEFSVAPKDLATVRVGQRVMVSSTAFDSQVEGVISYVGALLGEQTRTARARVTLKNPDGAWRPGLFVTVSVFGESQEVAVAVPVEAVQTVENQPTVFKSVADGFEATTVKVGRSDGRMVELLAGVEAGERVATKNTFILKSELGKSSAEHEH